MNGALPDRYVIGVGLVIIIESNTVATAGGELHSVLKAVEQSITESTLQWEVPTC